MVKDNLSPRLKLSLLTDNNDSDDRQPLIKNIPNLLTTRTQMIDNL